TARFGARAMMVASIVGFSTMMGIAAIAPTPEMFALCRLLSGIGLGAVMPTAISLTVEYSRRDRRQLNNALMFSGYSVGAILASTTGILALPHIGFRWMYAFGVLPLLLIPVILRVLPDSRSYLTKTGRSAEAQLLTDQYGLEPFIPADPSSTRSGLRGLFSRRFALPLGLFSAATFCGLLVIYGVNTWLPNIMNQAGYSIGMSLSFLAVLNAGAILGGITGAAVADRIGSKPIAILAFATATISTVLLSTGLPTWGLYLVVALLGLGTTGTQIIVTGWAAAFFPETYRTAAVGFVLGVGRLGAIVGPAAGGWITASALGYEWNYYTFATVALAGATTMALMPRIHRASTPVTTADDGQLSPAVAAPAGEGTRG
ncbi:MFS transporter, partial [Rhodococcus sp. NCIMB 12038]|uniref:MFS transporter n=1 Tax=Rhodococcus sp. NCIMB 12038 TaxID=933800 RepID=UPI001179E5E1